MIEFASSSDGKTFIVTVDGHSSKFLNTGLSEIEFEEYLEQNEEMILLEAKQKTIENIRIKRESEFNKFDKYQLTLLWGSLTDEQRQDYVKWRADWLEATETLKEPERLEWFVEGSII